METSFRRSLRKERTSGIMTSTNVYECTRSIAAYHFDVREIVATGTRRTLVQQILSCKLIHDGILAIHACIPYTRERWSVQICTGQKNNAIHKFECRHKNAFNWHPCIFRNGYWKPVYMQRNSVLLFCCFAWQSPSVWRTKRQPVFRGGQRTKL